MSTLDLAMNFLNQGIGVIPVTYRDKRPDANLLPKNTDGNPTWEPFKHQLPSPELIHSWLSRGQHNYGVVAGWQQLAIIDFDSSEEYTNWLLWVTKVGGKAKFVSQNAYRVQTARGVHVYVRLATPGSNQKFGKVDIKRNGYVLGPGSIHPSGAEYTALQSALIFPVIESLSEILPGSLLQTATLPTGVTIPRMGPSLAAAAGDPWKIAMETPKVSVSLDDLKAAYPVESFFTDTIETGKDWLLTRCPFHEDSKPSFWINTEQQICGCFAGCTSKPLDSINLYARLHGMDNHQAIRAMAAGRNETK